MISGCRTVHVATLCAFAVGVGLALISCGGGSSAQADGGQRCVSNCDASTTPALPDGGTCSAFSDAGEPRVPPTHVAFEGGVPLDKVAYAVAVARCNYWGRCLSFAPYIVRDCIDATLANGNTWSFGSCSGSASNYTCLESTISFPNAVPSAALLQAVDAGVVKYDPQQESACIEALQAEGCAQWDFPTSGPPACAAAFTCASDSGTNDAGSADEATTDAGGSCAAVLPRFVQQVPCSTNADCTDAVAPGGPYCFDGYCFPMPCGYFDFVDCTSFVESGQACDSDPPGFGGAMYVLNPKSACSLGLSCKGLVIGAGSVPSTLGVCAAPEDIGGRCVQGASVTGCMKGLVCPCGTCQLPPSEGPCVSNLCEVNVAYCDISSGTCKPVRQLGSACKDFVNECATNLHCDSTTNTCQPGQP